MKYIALLFICIMTYSTVFAGAPDEDFVVDLTRESFRDGSKPSEADLYLNFQWVCGSYGTRPGTLTGTAGITLNEVFFTQKDFKVINRSMYFPGGIPLKTSDKEFASYSVNDSGAITDYYFIRKNHGGLLIERALPTNSGFVDSIATPGLSAFSYSYCLPYDYESKAPKIMNYPWSDVYTNDLEK